MFGIGTTELIVILVIFTFIGTWLWALIHCILNKNLSNTMKIIGVILIVGLTHLGILIYFFLPREKIRTN